RRPPSRPPAHPEASQGLAVQVCGPDRSIHRRPPGTSRGGHGDLEPRVAASPGPGRTPRATTRMPDGLSAAPSLPGPAGEETGARLRAGRAETAPRRSAGPGTGGREPPPTIRVPRGRTVPSPAVRRRQGAPHPHAGPDRGRRAEIGRAHV